MKLTGIKIVCYILCAVFLTCFFYYYPDTIRIFVTDSNYRSNHFNLLSIAAILAGFMFTALSMLVGISDKEVIRSLAQTTILDRKQSRMVWGIRVDIGCILLSSIFILGGDSQIPLISQMFIIANEIILFVLGVYFLYRAMKDILRLLDLIRPEKEVPAEVLERLKRKMDE